MNELLDNHAPQGGMEAMDRVICAIDSYLGEIKSSLPIVTTANPFEILATKDLGMTNKWTISSSLQNVKDLPIVQPLWFCPLLLVLLEEVGLLKMFRLN